VLQQTARSPLGFIVQHVGSRHLVCLAAAELVRSPLGVVMDDELTPQEKFAAENPETMVPRALLEGRDPEDIVADLVRLDWTLPAARGLVAQATDDLRRLRESPEARRQLLREARGQFLAGILLALLAALLTAFTFLAALAGALPFFIVAFGVFFGGVVLMGRGWARWRLYRKTASPFGPAPENPGEPGATADRPRE
jgi:hypothetical protein